MRSPVILLLLLLTLSVYGQRDVIYFQQHQNRQTINPAATGMWGDIDGALGYRQQWTGFKEAPRTISLMASGFVHPWRSGFGLHYRNEKFGPQSTQNIKFNYAYFVPFNEFAFLAIGVGGGIMNNTYDETNFFAKDRNDDRLLYVKQTKVIPDFDAGLEFHMQYWQIGASVTHLSYTHEDNNLIRPLRNFFVYTRGKIPVTRYWDIIPGVLWHNSRALNTFEVSATARYNNNLSMTVSYRNPQTIGMMVGITLYQGFRLSYSFDYGFDNMSAYNSGSHEVWLSYNFPMTNTYIRTRLRFFRWKKW